MFKRMSVCFLLVATLVGCSTLPSPKEATSSAIVGELSVEFDKKWRIFHSGVHHSRIQVRLEELDSGRIERTYTNENGIYSFANISPGYYSISSWEIDKTSRSEHWVLVGNIGNGYVDVKPGELVIAPEIVGKVTVLSDTEFRFSFGSEVSKPNRSELIEYVEETNPEWTGFVQY